MTINIFDCDHWLVTALKIVFPLAIAVLVAGVIIGLAGYESSNVTCGSAFDTDSWPDKSQIAPEEWFRNQETCAIIRANKMPWATTLIATGLGLLVSSYLLRTAPRNSMRNR